MSVGAYAYVEVEGEIPGWVDVEVNASVRGGYGRDFVTDEHILYFEAECKLELDELAGSDNAEIGIGVVLEGEQRWRSNGDSYVDLAFSFRATTGAEKEFASKLFPEVEARAGLEITARAYLELDESTAEAAWKNLVNPMDGSLDLAEFLDRAGVTLQVSTVAETEFVDVDFDVKAASLEVEGFAEILSTDRLWMKAPRGEYERVDI